MINKDNKKLPYSCRFNGYVLPGPLNITFPTKFELDWDDADSGVSMRLKPHIEDSSVFVSVECSTEPSGIVDLLYKHSLDACRALVGIVGFHHGIGLSVIFKEVVFSDDDIRQLVLEDTNLSRLCTSYSHQNYPEIIKVVFDRVGLIQVFNDLMASLTIPHVSVVNCSRVIDALKKDHSPDAANEKMAWVRFQKSLNVSEDYLKYITSSSKDARHGSALYISGDICSEVTRRTWIVFDRYLNLLLSDAPVLDEVKFPLLVETKTAG